jgi:Lon protease-like protein
MKYENEKKLNSLITEIVNNESQILVDRLKDLESWKKENLSKIKEHDKLKNRNDILQSHIEMLV